MIHRSQRYCRWTLYARVSEINCKCCHKAWTLMIFYGNSLGMTSGVSSAVCGPPGALHDTATSISSCFFLHLDTHIIVTMIHRSQCYCRWNLLARNSEINRKWFHKAWPLMIFYSNSWGMTSGVSSAVRGAPGALHDTATSISCCFFLQLNTHIIVTMIHCSQCYCRWNLLARNSEINRKGFHKARPLMIFDGNDLGMTSGVSSAVRGAPGALHDTATSISCCFFLQLNTHIIVTIIHRSQCYCRWNLLARNSE